MANIIAQLRDKLIKNRLFQMGWLQKDQSHATEVETALAELPTDIAQQLAQLAQEQPSNPHDQQIMEDAITSAIALRSCSRRV